MVAKRDSIVPAHLGDRLHEQVRAPKRLWQIPGADHNDRQDHVDERWWAEVADYLLPTRPAGSERDLIERRTGS